MDLYTKLLHFYAVINNLEDEINHQNQQKAIDILKKYKDRAETFVSHQGTTWYKFPAQQYTETVGVGTNFFLTDLKGNYIPDKLHYKDQVCISGWIIGIYYCTTEQQAIDFFEGKEALE